MELTNIRKAEAKEAWEEMLSDYIGLCLQWAEDGFLTKEKLEVLVTKATEPFFHENNGYKTVVDGKEATCASILSMSAVDTVLSDKRKNDELSRVAAQQRKMKAKKGRTPNTTRGKCRIAVIQNIRNHNRQQEAENKVKAKDKLQKDITEATSVLTDLDKLVAKRNSSAARRGLSPDDANLWLFKTAGQFTKSERTCILKLCVPNSGVISKKELEHIKCFETNDVTLHTLNRDADKLRNELTSWQKQLRDVSEVREDLETSVEIAGCEDEDRFSNFDNKMLDSMLLWLIAHKY